MTTCGTCGVSREQGMRCKPCSRDYNKNWSATHPDYKQRWYANRPGYNRQYYLDNREAIKTRTREWHKNNPGRNKEWWDNHPGLKEERHHRRLAKKHGATGEFSAKEWLSILDIQSHKCALCLTPKKLEVDHIVPLSRGGSNYISNIQAVCGSCNKKKGSNLICNSYGV